MKKFTKIMLIIAGALVVLGLVLVIAAFAAGLNADMIKQAMRESQFSIDEKDFDLDDVFDDDIEPIDIGNETFQDLEIEFGAGKLEIRYEDVDRIQIQKTDIDNLKVNVRENTLHIKESSKPIINFGGDTDRGLIILIPRDMKFREVDLEIGATKAEISDILADEISVTVGAGVADISGITARHMDIEVGAGVVTATQIIVDELDVEAGLGEVNVTLSGVQEDYNYSVECGVGKVIIGENSYSGLGTEQSVRYESASKRIDVDCGLGDVIINFKK